MHVALFGTAKATYTPPDVDPDRRSAATCRRRRHDDELAAGPSYVAGVALPANGSVVSHSSLPVRLVEGAELPVVVRRADEDQPAGRDDRAAVVLAAGVLQSLRTSSGYSPSGICQAYSPVLRLMALSVPHGGATAG